MDNYLELEEPISEREKIVFKLQVLAKQRGEAKQSQAKQAEKMAETSKKKYVSFH